MLTQYMCSKHRSELERAPKLAKLAWFRMINSARYFSKNLHWESATKLYGNALNCAEVIFLDKPNSNEVNRFVRTAVEFLYMLRASGQTSHLALHERNLRHTLENGLYPANVQLLMRPIYDTIHSPIEDVGRWVTALLLADTKG